MTPMELMQKYAHVIAEQRKTQPLELEQFYREWYVWATTNKQVQNFVPWEGLCGLCPMYLQSYMKRQFAEVFGNTLHPFGWDAYVTLYSRNKHQDPNRLEWVRLHIPELNT